MLSLQTWIYPKKILQAVETGRDERNGINTTELVKFHTKKDMNERLVEKLVTTH
jgi:hypothetical protein